MNRRIPGVDDKPGMACGLGAAACPIDGLTLNERS
jgi:hypothetical protein